MQPSGCALRSCGSVGVAAVFDAQDDDLVLLVVDPVQHVVGAASGGVNAGQVCVQLLAYSLGLLDQRAGAELDDRCGHALRQRRLQGSCARSGRAVSPATCVCCIRTTTMGWATNTPTGSRWPDCCGCWGSTRELRRTASSPMWDGYGHVHGGSAVAVHDAAPAPVGSVAAGPARCEQPWGAGKCDHLAEAL